MNEAEETKSYESEHVQIQIPIYPNCKIWIQNSEFNW